MNEKIYTGKYVFIRADMNAEIATGHMMRCLSIADSVKAKGGRAVFISADDEPAELVASRGYELVNLGTDWRDMEGEVPKLLDYLKQYDEPVLLVDTYQVTEKYFDMLKGHAKVLYIDDLKAGAFNVDGLISYAVYAEDLKYPEYYRENNISAEFYLGLTYAPLRAMFRGCPGKKISEKIEKILIMSGGTDRYHMLDKFTEALAPKGYELTVICGRLNPDREVLLEKYKNCSKVHILASVDNMKDYIESADLTITAGGTTLYELCAVGTPAITFSFADNQLLNVGGFDSRRIMLCAGDARRDDVAGKTLELIEYYENPSIRAEMSERERASVDGLGSDRIAELLLN